MPLGKALIYNAQTGELKEIEIDLDTTLIDEFRVDADKIRIKADGVDTAKFNISFNKSWKIVDKRCLVTVIKDGATLTSDYVSLNEDTVNYTLYGTFEFAAEVEGVYTLQFTLGNFTKELKVEVYA